MNVSWRKSSYSTNNGGACVEVGTWRKSSHSTNNGGDCVEVGAATAAARPGRSAAGEDSAARWRTSTHSASNGGECVEIAATVAVRDTKDNGHGPVLRFTLRAWEAFATSFR